MKYKLWTELKEICLKMGKNNPPWKIKPKKKKKNGVKLRYNAAKQRL